MKHLVYILLLGLIIPLPTYSQTVYSYVTDRKFKDASELLGYNFKPFRLEIKDEKEENITAGSYSFGITQNNLYVTGQDIEGVYSINNINPTKFGYQLTLMNARNPALQGHLKVIVNSKKQVEALIFKRSTKDKEIIFLISPLSEEQKIAEEKYFTDKFELKIDEPDSIWGKTIFPFMGMYKVNGKQDKILPTDSVFVKFEKRTTIIEKKLKEKKPKKPKKIEKKKEEKKEEIVKEEAKKENEEEEDLSATKTETIEADTIKPVEKNLDEEEMESDSTQNQPKVKTKIIIQDYAVIRFRIKYDDGTFEDKKTELKINKVTMKEDAEAKPDEEKYQITVTPSSGSPFYIYLTGDKAVNSIEFPDKVYLVRGN